MSGLESAIAFVRALDWNSLSEVRSSLSTEDAQRLDVELALAGFASPIHIARDATRALGEPTSPERSGRIHDGARAFVRLGTPQLAKRILESLGETSESALLAAEQVESGCGRGRTRAALEAHRAETEETLENLAREGSERLEDRVRALRQLSRRAAARRDFAGAVGRLRAARELAPNAPWNTDALVQMTYLARFGELDAEERGAVAALDDAVAHEKNPRSRGRTALRRLEEGLKLAKRNASAAFLEPHGTITGPRGEMVTLAHVARAATLEGIVIVRARLGRELALAAVELGLPVMIEEERSTSTGYRWLLGYADRSELLLLRDVDGEGAEISTLAEQLERGALLDTGTLVVAGAGEEGVRNLEALRSRGVVACTILRALDGCDVNDDGEVPPPAYIRHVVGELAVNHPESQRVSNRWGELLRADARRDAANAAAFFSWYAEARERFGAVEWPVQRYAEFLEEHDRNAEASIAWAEAEHWDPRDERNSFGRGRAISWMGRARDAVNAYLRANAVAPDAKGICYWLACAASDDGDGELAELAGRIATELDPNHAGGHRALTNARESLGDLPGALTALETAYGLDESEATALRLAQAYASRGRLEDAARVTEAIHARGPSAETAAALADRDWMHGRHDRAQVLVAQALAHDNANGNALDALVRSVVLGDLGDEAITTALGELTVSFGESAASWGELFMKMGDRGLAQEAASLYPALRTASTSDPSSADWLIARTMAFEAGRVGSSLDAAIAMLRPLADESPTWDWPNFLVAAALLASDPEAALRYGERVRTHFAAAGFEITAQALTRLDRAAEAVEARDRAHTLDVDSVVRAAHSLRRAGFTGLAAATLDHARIRRAGAASLMIERVWVNHAARENEEAWEALARCEAEKIDLPWSLVVCVGARAKRWDHVARAARARADAIVKSSRDLGDAWVARAVEAGALLAVGDDHARERLLETCPAHPEALGTLVRIERMQNHRFAEEDEQRLRHVAKAAWARVTRTEVLPWT